MLYEKVKFTNKDYVTSYYHPHYNGAIECSNKATYQGPRYKHFPCLTQLSTKFILLINVKMPTIVGILLFISMINTTSEGLKAMNLFICRYCSFYEQLKFRAELS